MRSVQDLHYNDYDYLKDPVVEKPAPDLNDDADLEMIPKRIKQPKVHVEHDSVESFVAIGYHKDITAYDRACYSAALVLC